MQTATQFNACRPLQLIRHTPLTCLGFLAAVIVALSPAAQTLLEFDVTAITSGEYWRLLTGHAVHWSLDHCLWDLAVFVGLGVLCERRDSSAFRGCVLYSAIVISLYMLFLQQDVPTYRGLSGIDTGLFALLAMGMLADARAKRDRLLLTIIIAAVAGLAAKICWEFFFGSTLFVDNSAADFVPIPMAHVLGAGVGLVAGLTSRWCARSVAAERSIMI